MTENKSKPPRELTQSEKKIRDDSFVSGWLWGAFWATIALVFVTSLFHTPFSDPKQNAWTDEEIADCAVGWNKDLRITTGAAKFIVRFTDGEGKVLRCDRNWDPED